MNLETLLAATRQESDERQARDSLETIRAKIRDLPPCRGFAARLKAERFSLIAEVKAKSPSMGELGGPEAAQLASVHQIYDRHAVVSAISVLTQSAHFGGSPEVLRKIRRETRKPVLRKDFIFSEYEVYYSRYLEADALLLMTNVVADPGRFRELHDLAQSLGMDVLCEVHAEADLAVLPPGVGMVGVNSRNFASASRFGLSKVFRLAGKDITTDLRAFELFARLPAQALKIAESGLNAGNIAGVVGRYGFDAALVGTSLLRGGTQHAAAELDRFEAAIRLAKPGMARESGSGTAPARA